MKSGEILLRKGAEAELYKGEHSGMPALIKKRVPKGYRNEILDRAIRAQRTKGEASLLRKSRDLGVETPKVYEANLDEFYITMEFIEGPRIKDCLKKENLRQIARSIGKNIAKMHENHLIHGDLTTSNIILHNKNLVFIDYGLGFLSRKIEDKAVDLLVFKKTFEATHSSLLRGWKHIIEGYLKEGGKKEVIERIGQIEKRARYH